MPFLTNIKVNIGKTEKQGHRLNCIMIATINCSWLGTADFDIGFQHCILHYRTHSASSCQIFWTSVKPLMRYSNFSIFQYGGRRHLGFSKIHNFNGRSTVRGQYASSRQILSKSAKRLTRYRNLTNFKMAAVRRLEFLKLKFLTAGRLRNPFCIMLPNFVKIGSSRCWDIAVFRFSNMAVAAMLDFQ